MIFSSPDKNKINPRQVRLYKYAETEELDVTLEYWCGGEACQQGHCRMFAAFPIVKLPRLTVLRYHLLYV